MRGLAVVMVLCGLGACKREADPPQRLHLDMRSAQTHTREDWDWVDGGLEWTWSTGSLGGRKHHRFTPSRAEWGELYRKLDAEDVWSRVSVGRSGTSDLPSVAVELEAHGKSLTVNGVPDLGPLFEGLRKMHDAADGGVRLEPDVEGERHPY